MQTTNDAKKDNRPATLKTTLTRYMFTADSAAWLKLCDTLNYEIAAGLRGSFMNCYPSRAETLPGADRETFEIELETNFPFENQWNATDSPANGPWQNYRVFDWYEPIYTNEKIHTGYFLAMTPEIVDFRSRLSKCGYCGASYYDAQQAFCDRCYGSEYLKPADYYLLRLKTLSAGFHVKREALTRVEFKTLETAILDAQEKASGRREIARLSRQRQRIEEKYKERCDLSRDKEEHDGMLWLLDHGMEVDNVIYYSHARVFSFGWQTVLSKEREQDIAQRLIPGGESEEGFPFAYELKSVEGKQGPFKDHVTVV